MAWTQPARATEDEQRAFLGAAYRLHKDRGTARGIRDAVERHTGIRGDSESAARVGRATIGNSFSLVRATTHTTGWHQRKTIGDTDAAITYTGRRVLYSVNALRLFLSA